MSQADGEAFAKLVQVMDRLLGPDGCPWDQRQTPVSLCDYVIEEAFELAEAIRSGDPAHAREELGDVMFLLVFAAALYERQGDFTQVQVLEAITAKMIRRHPHVFGDSVVENQEQLLQNWERIKRQEKGHAAGIFDSLPKGLPPLLKAYRLNAKAARNRFTWDKDQDQRGQLDAEWRELAQAVAQGDQAAMEEEFGDYLFCLVEYGRRLGIKANSALETANRKFLRRFEAMEVLAAERGLDVSNFSLADWNALWDEVKAAGGQNPGTNRGG
jgi:nucleoside triphosphate diphosphatase